MQWDVFTKIGVFQGILRLTAHPAWGEVSTAPQQAGQEPCGGSNGQPSRTWADEPEAARRHSGRTTSGSWGMWFLLKHIRCLLSLWSEISLHSMHYFFHEKHTLQRGGSPFNKNAYFTFRYVLSLWRKRQVISEKKKKKWYLIYFKNSNKILVIRARLLGNHYRSQYPAPGKHLQSTRWSLVK